MWKVSLVLIACAAGLIHARPSYLPPPATTYEHVEYAPTVIGTTLHTLPAAVSHQSSTVVHEKRPYLRPIIEHAPVWKTYSPVVKTSVWPPTSGAWSPTSSAWPVAYSPLPYSGLYDHGWSPSLSSVYGGYGGYGSYGGWSGWPLK